MTDGILLLRGGEVAALLSGRESEIVNAVAGAYRVHGQARSSLPHSTFLRFPGDDLNRIIALPAYLGDGFDVAGMKWIASFPGNLARGLARASAVMVINSCETGRPTAILEGSVVSAQRTAASAALAARELTAGLGPIPEAGLIGTGLINFETARFLQSVLPSIERVLLYDLDPARAERFARRVEDELPGLGAEVVASRDELLARSRLTAFATTAGEPHVQTLAPCPPGTTVLHTSLRDLSPEVILASDNVVDDPDHVCRARTSVHLTEQATGSRDFIRCTLADVLSGREPARPDPERTTVFSPFGLGVLDLAVAQLVLEGARENGVGTSIDSFFQ